MLSYSPRDSLATTKMDEEPEKLPQKGDRPQSYSPAYKYACREFALLSRTSTRKLPHVHLFIVRATLRELQRLGSISSMPDLRDLARIIPMNYANIIDFGRRLDDWVWKQQVEQLPAAFIVSDDGNSANNKNTYNIICGYLQGKILKINASGAPSGSDAAAIAGSIKADGRRLGVRKWAGSCTDSAAVVLSGVAAEMAKDWAEFISGGCVLHILNLILCNSYIAAFGDEEWGVCSALRLGFMVHYMMTKLPDFKDSYYRFCDDKGYHGAKYVCPGASTTRWWSIVSAFGSIYRHRTVYIEWFDLMAAGNDSPTFQPLFVEIAKWLRVEKCIADIAFVLDFNDAWWVGEMNFAQGIGPWQSGVQRADQLAGFRADEYSVRCVLMRRRLVALKNDACGGGGGGGGGVATSFARADEWRAKLSRDAPMAAEGGSGSSGGGVSSLSDYDYSAEQRRVFFETALATAGNHHKRWLVQLLPCSIYHPCRRLGVAVAAAIIARLDGNELPDIDGDEKVDVGGGEMVLLEGLVRALLQFATPDDLESRCVLTADAAAVEDIRAWVAAGGDFESEAGKRLEPQLQALVLGRPIHSHMAEHLVGVGVQLHRAFGNHETAQHFSSRLTATTNGTAKDLREAACAFAAAQQAQYDAEKGRHSTESPWVCDKPPGKRKRERVESSMFRNKAVLGAAVACYERRSAQIEADGAVAAAYLHAGQVSAAGDDLATMSEERSRKKSTAVKEKAQARIGNNQMAQYSAGDMAAAAASVVVPRREFGMDLRTVLESRKPGDSTDDLVAECAARNIQLPLKRNSTEVKKSGKDSNGVAISKSYFIGLLRAHHPGLDIILRQSDVRASARAWEGDSDVESDDDSPVIPL